MKIHDPAGTIVAVLFAAFGTVLIVSTGTMTPMGSVFPITISAALVVLSLVLILRNVVLGVRAQKTATDFEAAAIEGDTAGSMPRRIVFLVTMAAWIALIPVLGFFVASVLAYFAIMAIATHERLPIKEIAILAVTGFAILSGFYLMMTNVLLIPMPRSLLF